MDNKQIEDWILEGFTDDEIQAKIDAIEEAKHAPDEDYMAIRTAIMDEEDDDAAPGPATDTIQGTVNRLVTAIDKVGENILSEDIVLTFDDGTNESIKVGK